MKKIKLKSGFFTFGDSAKECKTIYEVDANAFYLWCMQQENQQNNELSQNNRNELNVEDVGCKETSIPTNDE